MYTGESLDYREGGSCVHVAREGSGGWAGGCRSPVLSGGAAEGAAPLQTKQAERVLERIYLIQIYCCYFIKIK